MATKKYLSLDKLSLYDEKIKKVISDGDTAALDYASGLVNTLVTSGQVKTNTDAIAAINDTEDGILAQSKGYTDGEIDKVEQYVGTIPTGSGVSSVIAYVDKKTTGIATSGALEELDGKVTTLIGDDANKSVRTIANEELVKQLIAEGADASLDSLIEIAAWIQSHPDDAAAMNEAIGNLEDLVGEIPADATATTVVGYAGELNNAMNLRVEALEAVDHDHTNKTVLDGITSTKVSGWDDAASKKHEHSNKALLDTYTQTEANLKDAVDKKHNHANKTELDLIASGDKNKWDTAAAKAHEHGNKTVLDGITSAKVTAWDNALDNAKSYTDGLIAEFEEVTTAEIEALFTAEA